MKNGSYAKVTPQQKYSCVREASSRTQMVQPTVSYYENTCGYPEVGVANLNPCDPRKLFPRNFKKCYSAKIVPLENLAPYGNYSHHCQGKESSGNEQHKCFRSVTSSIRTFHALEAV